MSTFTGDEAVPGLFGSGSGKTRNNHYHVKQPRPVVRRVWHEGDKSSANPAQNLSEFREVCYIILILTSPAYT
jgi:hypothetical protein